MQKGDILVSMILDIFCPEFGHFWVKSISLYVTIVDRNGPDIIQSFFWCRDKEIEICFCTSVWTIISEVLFVWIIFLVHDFKVTRKTYVWKIHPLKSGLSRSSKLMVFKVNKAKEIKETIFLQMAYICSDNKLKCLDNAMPQKVLFFLTLFIGWKIGQENYSHTEMPIQI